MPYDDGPDPMGLELVDLNGSWYLFITNPIMLGQQNEPGGDWETVLSDLVDDNLALVDSTAAEPSILNAVNSVRGFQMGSGTVESGRVFVSELKDNNSRAVFDFPAARKTVDYVQRKATARMQVIWNAGFDPSDYDGVYLPVVGFERIGTFVEKERFPVQEVSYGPIN